MNGVSRVRFGLDNTSIGQKTNNEIPTKTNSKSNKNTSVKDGILSKFNENKSKYAATGIDFALVFAAFELIHIRAIKHIEKKIFKNILHFVFAGIGAIYAGCHASNLAPTPGKFIVKKLQQNNKSETPKSENSENKAEPAEDKPEEIKAETAKPTEKPVEIKETPKPQTPVEPKEVPVNTNQLPVMPEFTTAMTLPKLPVNI